MTEAHTTVVSVICAHRMPYTCCCGVGGAEEGGSA
jgi:hypothetical protein